MATHGKVPPLFSYSPQSSRSWQAWNTRCIKLRYMPAGIFFIMFTFFMAVSDPTHGIKLPMKTTSDWKQQSEALQRGFKGMISDMRRRPLDMETQETVEKIQQVMMPPTNDTASTPLGTQNLPRGFIQTTSDLALRPLDNKIEDKIQRDMPKNLLAMAVGIKQKDIVDQVVQKFPLRNFTIMLFHYDGIVEEWSNLPWSNQSIHVVAMRQSKWWFAKRFLHPDIVDQYNYIFLWDEDLGVEHFNATRYLNIMEEEGLEITQPALDPVSVVNHKFTMKRPGRVHRRVIKRKGKSMCTKDSTGPPCTGWVEVMAPVFSKAAWRCTWSMIQNDLVNGWGLDMKLGYCAQGIRSEKIGVIDDQYIVHKGIPTSKSASGSRAEVRKQSHVEMSIFAQRWEEAVMNDTSWVDPFPSPKEEFHFLPLW